MIYVIYDDDRLSSMGYVFIINNGAVRWRSTRTPYVTLSAAESEGIALSAATQEAVYHAQACKRIRVHSNITHYPL